MQKPNWFDLEFEQKMEGETAEQVLADIANAPRIVKAVQDALDARDARGNMPGPSRTQVIRKAIAEVLQAD